MSGERQPVTIHIDDRDYQAEAGQNLLHACLSLKLDLPYFCWHPVLGSVGACRQCAVKQFKDESDTRGRIVMACMTPATAGTRISIADPEAAAFRASVIEWLMENHPHDCPVCDEGGECHLQDMTLMTGHTVRRYRFPKRTHHNQDLGPFLAHEMNRCIQCYRCVRYYRDYAGGRDLDVFGAHDQVYFGRQTDGALESEFAGNLVEVCPTGVFTDKTLARHYTRKWDLQNAPSICVHCSLGCNTIAGERYGGLRRIVNRYNGEVNGYFLCDRGRFGYEFVNGAQRQRGLTIDGVAGTWAAVVQRLAPLLGAGRVMGIGSPRASLESNYALRALVGADHFSTGLSARDAELCGAVVDILRRTGVATPSLREVRESDAVLALGEDVADTAPVMALALRQAARQQPLRRTDALKIPRWQDAAVRDALQGATGPFFVATPAITRLDDLATATLRAAPDDIARLGFAVAAELGGLAIPAGLDDSTRTLARDVARALVEAERPLVVSGTSLGSRSVVEAAGQVATALKARGRAARLAFALPECNSLGVAILGGRDVPGAFAALRQGGIDAVIVVENDLYRRASPREVDDFLVRAGHLVVIDHVDTGTSRRAEVLLPAATFAEGDGTLVNQEGRAQRFYQVFAPTGEMRESWRWIRELLAVAGRSDGRAWEALPAITAEIAAALPALAPIRALEPPVSFRGGNPLESVARQSHRYSGRTAILADRTVHEPAPPRDPDSPLVFSMEGRPGVPPPALIPLIWAPGWNSVQATNKLQDEIGGPLIGGDPGRRLIEPNGAHAAAPQELPPAFAPRPDQVLLVPLHRVFGSEELSALAPGIRERTAGALVVLSEADAQARGVRPGDRLSVEVDTLRLELPLGLFQGLPRGLGGLTVGLPELPWAPLPGWAVVRRAG